jgi:hypothetical protein
LVVKTCTDPDVFDCHSFLTHCDCCDSVQLAGNMEADRLARAGAFADYDSEEDDSDDYY